MTKSKTARRILTGAAVAAALGIGLGAWMKPSLAESPDPDPYENVVITLPADPAPSATQLTAADWGGYAIPASPGVWPTADSPASETAYLEPVTWSDGDSAAGSLTQEEVDAVLPDPATADPAASDSAPPASAPEQARQAIAAAGPAVKLQPGDWDLPASAYRTSDQG